MTSKHDRIAELAAIAKQRQDHKLHLNTLELVIHAMVHNTSVKETRALLLWYARHLREFHT